MIITLPATTMHIGTQLSKQYALEMAMNRRMLLKVLSSMKFLARQGLPFRGHNDDSDGNQIQLLRHRGEEDVELFNWLQRKTNKYTSHEIQNRLIQIMGLHVLRKLANKIQNSPFFFYND